MKLDIDKLIDSLGCFIVPLAFIGMALVLGFIEFLFGHAILILIDYYKPIGIALIALTIVGYVRSNKKKKYLTGILYLVGGILLLILFLVFAVFLFTGVQSFLTSDIFDTILMTLITLFIVGVIASFTVE